MFLIRLLLIGLLLCACATELRAPHEDGDVKRSAPVKRTTFDRNF